MDRRTGRPLMGTASPGDTGEAAPALAAALTAYHHDRGRYAEALGALLEARVLVPVVAVLGEAEVDEAGRTRDKSSEMATVLLTGADGRLALLAFSGTEALRAWDPQARPVPVTARAAAQAARQDGAAALLLDVAGPVRLVVEGDDLDRLADGWRLARLGGEVVWVAGAPPADRAGD